MGGVEGSGEIFINFVSLAESTKRVRILFEELQGSSEAAPVDEDGDDDRRCSNNGVLCDIARGGWLMVVGQTERESKWWVKEKDSKCGGTIS